MLSNIVNEVDTLDKAWRKWYDLLNNTNDSHESRDGDVHSEILNAITIIKDPTKNIMKDPVRNLSMRYGIGELLWYLSANNKLSQIQKYTKGWDRMTDDGVTVNSNYGYCITCSIQSL